MTDEQRELPDREADGACADAVKLPVTDVQPDAVPDAEKVQPDADGMAEKPELLRRAKIKQTAVILSMVLLFLLLVAAVVANPPLEMQTASGGQYSLRRMATLLTPGVDPDLELSYAPIQSKERYALSITEENRYVHGNAIRTEFRGTVVLGPAAGGQDRGVMMQLEDVTAVVFDGDEARPVQHLDTMMEGVVMEGRLDARAGLGRLVPRVNSNPQVERVLYLTGDVLRFAWPMLPEGKLGMGGMWSVQDHSTDGEIIGMQFTRKPEFYGAEYVRHVSGLPLGRGHAELVILDGRPTSLHGSIGVESSGQAAGALSHKVAFSLNRIL